MVEVETRNLASYDQFTDFTKINSIIIFSEDAYNKLQKLITESLEKGYETGVFFMGKELNKKDSNIIYIDQYTTDFSHADANVEGGAVEDTQESQFMRRECSQKYGYNCMFHFHVHIKPSGSYYDVFSDQDIELLFNYAIKPYFQYFTKEDIERILKRNISAQEYRDIRKRLLNDRPILDNMDLEQKKTINKQIVNNRNIDYFAFLASPNRDAITSNYQLSVIYAMPSINEETGNITANVYNFSNLYYLDGNDLYRIGSFKRKNPPKLTSNRIVSDTSILVQAIGYDPNTGKRIEDTKVGTFEDNTIKFKEIDTSRRR